MIAGDIGASGADRVVRGAVVWNVATVVAGAGVVWNVVTVAGGGVGAVVWNVATVVAGAVASISTIGVSDRVV